MRGFSRSWPSVYPCGRASAYPPNKTNPSPHPLTYPPPYGKLP
ncbi:hypothetical protein [Salmonella phage SD-14_S20]|nr:hypothetical protein [Salmonella phage SD-11_S17]WPK20439.1 hypothetical protein [Salmonella phage SD-14_S20]